MNFFILFQISLTHLRSHLRQTIVATLGVMAGIGMYVALISFMTGLNELLDNLMMNNVAHVRLYNDIDNSYTPLANKLDSTNSLNIVHHPKPQNTQKDIRNSIQIMNILQNDNRVAAIAPRLTTQAFYTFGATVINGTVLGIDIQKEQQVFDVAPYVIEGKLEDLDLYTNGIILGMGLAQKLAVTVGDRINVTSSTGAQFSMKVVGLYESGVAMIDDVQSYTKIVTAQKLMQKGKDYITDINIDLKDKSNAKELTEEYHRRFGTNAQDFETANAQIEAGSSVRNIITYAVSVTLLLIAGFGIYNILTMMIYEKMDDIAILKATGFSGQDVKVIFILQAVLIGIFGGILGVALGYSASMFIDQLPFDSMAFKTIDTYPVVYHIDDYAIGVGFAMLTTFLAGYFPAQKASDVDPVDIIRGK